MDPIAQHARHLQVCTEVCPSHPTIMASMRCQQMVTVCPMVDTLPVYKLTSWLLKLARSLLWGMKRPWSSPGQCAKGSRHALRLMLTDSLVGDIHRICMQVMGVRCWWNYEDWAAQSMHLCRLKPFCVQTASLLPPKIIIHGSTLTLQ